MQPYLLLLTLLLNTVQDSRCARFLAILPLPSRSHSIWYNSIFQLLTQKGHELVVYSSMSLPNPIDNLTFVELQNSLSFLAEEWKFENFSKSLTEQSFCGFGGKLAFEFGTTMSNDLFQDKNIQDLLRSDEKFDLVFIEVTVGQESQLVFGHKFKAPVINLQGFCSWNVVKWITGNPLSVAYMPDCLSFPFNDKMSFAERLNNFVSTFGTLLLYHFDHLPTHEKIIQKHYKDPSTPPITDMIKDISMTFVNAHAAVDYPHPYAPNVIPIAGVHMASHIAPLPQNIKKFMDDAKEGVIFFSLGTLVPAHDLPRYYLEAFINTFRKLPQKVLWKVNVDNVAGLPENVMLTKWVPQPSVLAHPNCVLFITQGGLFSQFEAFHAGVPVVAIPFLVEQRYNVRLYEHFGVGVKLEFTTLTEESFNNAVTTVLSNLRYAENAKRLSVIYKDRPVSAADSLVFWVEYVLRHRGAHHLRPASATMAWYQLALLDVLAAVLAAALVVLIVLYKLLKKLYRICFGYRVSKALSKKKRN